MFAGYEQVYGASRSTAMTVQGTVGKTFGLLAILSATAIWSWTATGRGQMQPVVLMGAGIGGFILAMLTIFRPSLAPWTAPVYAAFEGVFLGILSYIIEHSGARIVCAHGDYLDAIDGLNTSMQRLNDSVKALDAAGPPPARRRLP